MNTKTFARNNEYIADISFLKALQMAYVQSKKRRCHQIIKLSNITSSNIKVIGI